MANRLSEDEILAQIPAARAHAERKRTAGLFAISVKFDKQTSRFLLELTNGALLGVPVSALPELSRAKPNQLAEVELTPSGGALHFEDFDADFSVPGIVLATIGKKLVAKAFAGVGGSATSEAKSAAARLNGTKGGRPRKRESSDLRRNSQIKQVARTGKRVYLAAKQGAKRSTQSGETRHKH